MAKVHTIQIRLTKAQYEQIKANSLMKGFESMSAFLRFLALKQDTALQEKISQIHTHLLGEEPRHKFKKNPAALG